MKLNLKEHHERMLLEANLTKDGFDTDLKEFALELHDAMGELVAIYESDDILVEAKALTMPQLQTMFQKIPDIMRNAPKGDTGGSNLAPKLGKLRQAGGKAAEAVGKIDGILNNAIAKFGKIGKVKDFNTKFNKYKNEFLEKNPKTKKVIDKIGEYAEKYPKSEAFLIGSLAGLASFAGSPLAGLALGSVLRTASGVAKGEDLTTAFGKSLKTGMIGSLIGGTVGAITDALGSATNAVIDVVRDMSTPVEEFWRTNTIIGINGLTFQFEGYATMEMAEQLKDLEAKADALKMGSPEWVEAKGNYLAAMDAVYNNAEVQEQIRQQMEANGVEKAERIEIKDKTSQAQKIVGAITAGAGAGAAAKKFK